LKSTTKCWGGSRCFAKAKEPVASHRSFISSLAEKPHGIAATEPKAIEIPKLRKMHIHLITYATPRFRLRQLILGWSARANGVVNTVTHWTPKRLLATGFEDRCKDIKLTERGSGFWAWKPFIIEAKLREVPDGDLVFYCDVGRKYPFIILEHSLDCYIDWMRAHSQDIMPGVMIPWNGTMETWTKADAFFNTCLDKPHIRQASPIQASFSLWCASVSAKSFVHEWLALCLQRKLISDDPSQTVVAESHLFRGHRHDQSLLSLCCLRHSIKGIELGNESPNFNEKDPGMVADRHFGSRSKINFLGRIIAIMASILAIFEQIVRSKVNFGRACD
jgi:hypothetical protein